MDKALYIRKLRCVTAAIFLVWIVAQCIVAIHYWGVPQYSDAGLDAGVGNHCCSGQLCKACCNPVHRAGGSLHVHTSVRMANYDFVCRRYLTDDIVNK